MIKKAVFLFVALLLICAAPVLTANEEAKPVKDVKVLLKTSKGDIKLEVYASKTPVTAANFLNLVKRGYYNGVTFHRVIPNFMIQTGDTTGTGAGTPGYMFKHEIVPSLKHDGPGVLSMACLPTPDTNGSQFFITHRATPHLDGKHTVFGKVLEGQDIVDKIQQGDKILEVKLIDSPDEILKAQAKHVEEWNRILDKNGNKSVLPNE